MASAAISHTWWRGSKPTLGSLARSYGPAGEELAVSDGRNPLLHVAPASFDVAQPMSELPPSVKRPDWNAETIVFPDANVSGSTCVWCWLVVFVKGSELIWVTPAGGGGGGGGVWVTVKEFWF